MNFEDEPFVRVYKRRTATMAVIGWEARAVLRELFLVVDRAGVLDLDDEDPADAVAAVLSDVPVEVVRAALERLAKKDCVKVVGSRLVIPRFRDAQEAAMSDALRQRESRARRRDEALRSVTDCNVDVTVSDADDTIGHSASRRVTQNSTEQNITETEQDLLVEPPAAPRARPARRIPEVPVPMSPEWQPSASQVDALAQRFETTPDRIRSCVPEFRNYWLEGKGQSTRRGPKGWASTFSNRITSMAQRGDLYLGPSNATRSSGRQPPQPNDPANRYVPERVIS